MKILKAIALSALYIPLFFTFLLLCMLLIPHLIDIVQHGEIVGDINDDILVITDTILAVCFFTIAPVFLLGWPACIIASRYNMLKKYKILVMGALLGGGYSACMAWWIMGDWNFEYMSVVFLTGALYGLFTGLFFCRHYYKAA